MMNRFQTLLSVSTCAATFWMFIESVVKDAKGRGIADKYPTWVGSRVGDISTGARANSSSFGHLYHVYEVLYGQSHLMTWMIPGTGVIEINYSTARSTFARLWVNAHTDARTRFVIADRPQTLVWALLTLSLANVDMAVYGDMAVGRVVILNNPRAGP